MYISITVSNHGLRPLLSASKIKHLWEALPAAFLHLHRTRQPSKVSLLPSPPIHRSRRHVTLSRANEKQKHF